MAVLHLDLAGWLVVAREGPTLVLARPQAVEAAGVVARELAVVLLHLLQGFLPKPGGLEAADVVVVAGPAALSQPFFQSGPVIQLLNCLSLMLRLQFGPFFGSFFGFFPICSSFF